MIPCLRKLISLGNTVRTDIPKMLWGLLDSQAATGARSGTVWVRRIVDRVVGRHSLTGRTAIGSVISHDPEFVEILAA